MTYNDENLPSPPLISKRHAQLYIKRLRKHISQNRISNVKYFLCGEYGELGDRPHYHAIIFNYEPSDLLFYKMSPSGELLYTSDELEKIWGMGFTTIGYASQASIRYCMKYITKIGPHGHKPFILMSKGIGKTYFEKNVNKIMEEQKVKTKFGDSPIPRYYIKKIHENIDKDFLINEEYLSKKNKQNEINEYNIRKKFRRLHKLTNYQEYINRFRIGILHEEWLENNPIWK
jgi:hypothetical protein